MAASDKAELAANRGRYPGRPLQLLLGGPLGGVISVGAALRAAVQTPVLSWAFFKVQSGLGSREWMSYQLQSTPRLTLVLLCGAGIRS